MIAGREVGPSEPPYVIAEISANHRGDRSLAVELVRAASEAGADAVKLQHYTADAITVRSSHPDMQLRGGTLWDGRQLYDLYEEAATPWEWTAALVDEAVRCGITWFSSPFDAAAIDLLDSLDAPALKIASFELVDLPLIRRAAATGRPIIMSTGMATVGEIDAAVAAARNAGASDLALLRCNSGYPASPVEMDLRAIPVMADLWSVPIGLSDHTLGHTAAVAAVALGACIIEKHVTMRRSDGGPDAAFSAEPDELAALVGAVREAHASLGRPRFGPSAREEASIAYRRSLRASRPIRRGQVLTDDDVRSMRPAGGLPPDAINLVLGSVAARDLGQGDPVTAADLCPPGEADGA